VSSYVTSLTVPVPVASVIPAAARAATGIGLLVEGQMPASMRCRTGGMLTAWPVTLDVSVAGSDGAAVVTVVARSFGIGPLAGRARRVRATQLAGVIGAVLQGWAGTAPPTAPPKDAAT
jgi:hypothetical protein